MPGRGDVLTGLTSLGRQESDGRMEGLIGSPSPPLIRGKGLNFSGPQFLLLRNGPIYISSWGWCLGAPGRIHANHTAWPRVRQLLLLFHASEPLLKAALEFVLTVHVVPPKTEHNGSSQGSARECNSKGSVCLDAAAPESKRNWDQKPEPKIKARK